MRFGVLMPVFGSYAQGSGAAEAHRVLAQRAEALGFDSLWVPDHIVLPTQMPESYPYSESGKSPLPADCPIFEALTYLSFIAATTTRIRLGTSILVLPHRNPILTAKMMATLDVLSGGRMILGAGVGYLEEEITALGAPFAQRGALSDEYIGAMRQLWTNPDPAFAGEFVSFKDIKCEPKPLQSPLPIWLGGHSRRMMRRIVDVADGCIFAAYEFESFKAQHRLLLEEAAAAKRDPDSIDKAVFLTAAPSIDACLEQIDQYGAQGMDNFIVPLPAWGLTLSDYLDALAEFAHKVNMKGAE